MAQAELLDRARQGDRDAFAALVETHYDFIHAVAWRWCGDAGDAQDIAQETAIRLARAIRSFRGEAQFRTWLYRLTLNAVHDHQRANGRRRRNEQRFANDPAFFACDDNGEDGRSDWLWHCVRLLPEKQRDAVLLVYGEGLSHGAAAEVLGCGEKTVSWHLHEARKRLKALAQKEAV